MTRFDLDEPMTRRKVLVLGVAGAAAAVLAACGASTSSPTSVGAESSNGGPAPDGSGLRIRMLGDDAIGGTFEPGQLSLRVGDTVTWENASAIIHTATCDPDNPLGVPHVLPAGADAFNSGNVNPGDTFQQTFDVAGEYTYSCMHHTDAVGQLTVSA